MGWKIISKQSLLRTKSRDNDSSVSSVGQTPDRPGRVTVFLG